MTWITNKAIVHTYFEKKKKKHISIYVQPRISSNYQKSINLINFLHMANHASLLYLLELPTRGQFQPSQWEAWAPIDLPSPLDLIASTGITLVQWQAGSFFLTHLGSTSSFLVVINMFLSSLGSCKIALLFNRFSFMLSNLHLLMYWKQFGLSDQSYHKNDKKV